MAYRIPSKSAIYVVEHGDLKSIVLYLYNCLRRIVFAKECGGIFEVQVALFFRAKTGCRQCVSAQGKEAQALLLLYSSHMGRICIGVRCQIYLLELQEDYWKCRI